MRHVSTLFLMLIGTSVAMDDDRSLKFSTSGKFLPAMNAIYVTKTGDGSHGTVRHNSEATITEYGKTAKLGEGPFDIWWEGKNGIAVLVVKNVKLKDGEVKEVKIDEYVGIVNVRGDDLPRVGLVTIAPQDDPGPDEKKHLAVQTAKDYRVEMVVPEGFYSFWITPDNGARPRKINDRFRVQAGKTVQLD